MTALFNELIIRGCKIDEAMERFINDEALYKECLEQLLTDPAFDELGQALKAHDLTTAFDKAHTLKGIIANMSITSLYDIIVKIVEPLRHKEDTDLLSVYEELLSEVAEYRQLLMKYEKHETFECSGKKMR